MSTVYVRKLTNQPRGQWSKDGLLEALDRLRAGKIGIRQAERKYGVPTRTLRRCVMDNNTSKIRVGPDCKCNYVCYNCYLIISSYSFLLYNFF